MGVKRYLTAVAVVLSLGLAGCGDAVSSGGPEPSTGSVSASPDPTYPTGVSVTSIDDACKAITAEEISAKIGIQVTVLDEWDMADVGMVSTSHGVHGRLCRYSSSSFDDITKGVIVGVWVVYDPDDEVYGLEPGGVDNISEVDGLGDKGFVNDTKLGRILHLAYTTKWGVWTAKASADTADSTGIALDFGQGLVDVLNDLATIP